MISERYLYLLSIFTMLPILHLLQNGQPGKDGQQVEERLYCFNP